MCKPSSGSALGDYLERRTTCKDLFVYNVSRLFFFNCSDSTKVARLKFLRYKLEQHEHHSSISGLNLINTLLQGVLHVSSQHDCMMKIKYYFSNTTKKTMNKTCYFLGLQQFNHCVCIKKNCQRSPYPISSCYMTFWTSCLSEPLNGQMLICKIQAVPPSP